MKSNIKILGFALLTFVSAGNALAQIGKPFIHDPSTIMECEGKYYTFGTRGGGLISEDGWTWNSGVKDPGGGAALMQSKLVFVISLYMGQPVVVWAVVMMVK